LGGGFDGGDGLWIRRGKRGDEVRQREKISGGGDGGRRLLCGGGDYVCSCEDVVASKDRIECVVGAGVC
jgi:hypothetical protein